MADTSTTTIKAIFNTREAADLAIEHMVQQYGVARSDIFVQSVTDQSSAGIEPSGSDRSHEDGTRDDGALEGEIEVSADIAAHQLADVQRSVGDAGAIRVTGR